MNRTAAVFLAMTVGVVPLTAGAAGEECSFEVTNCVINDKYRGYVTVKTFDGSDTVKIIEYDTEYAEERGDTVSVGCSESECDTRVYVKWDDNTESASHNDACEDLWVTGSADDPRLRTSSAC